MMGMTDNVELNHQKCWACAGYVGDATANQASKARSHAGRLEPGVAVPPNRRTAVGWARAHRVRRVA